ncbi:related to monocarboxylate transporter 4 [Cephalotrichum gorgonifer]|uniref:Related to monocarboxylate transporter 4 n=1 Tax=Cephalotrichum gorgonifer TaxID=2041049 RepID=A0AAE8SWC9_9PEZI|nr:related to monocarboxylate transporter 4 [Cephalotrichum gorgonifer]
MSLDSTETSVDLKQPPREGEEEPSTEKPSEVPDGGRVAWAHVLFTHIVFFNTWGVANGFGIFQQYYTQNLTQSPSSISWIGSIQVFLLFFIGVASGRLTDAGHFRAIFACGVFLQVLGLFMTSLCTSYWQIFLAQGVCVGAGNGCTFCPALAVLSQYFSKRRGFAVGLAAAGAALGGLVYPVLINWLIFYDDIGFPWTLRIMGFIMLATYLPCLLWYKTRLPPRTSGPWIDTSAFTELPFMLFTGSMFLNFWGLYFAFFYLGTFARDQMGITEPIYLLMLLNGVGVIGRIVPTIVADKCTGLSNLLIPVNFSAALMVYCWAAVVSKGGLYAFAIIYGLFAAALQALFPAVATTMTPDPSRTGTRVGMILGLVSFANLTGPAICGVLIRNQDGSYLAAQMFAGSSILLGAILALGARIAKTGLVVRVKI